MAHISANVNGLSAFCYNPPPLRLLALGEAEIQAESLLQKAEIRAVNLPRPSPQW
jgi:hypothetical protein